LKGDGVRWVVS
jgi:hypothetical protein